MRHFLLPVICLLCLTVSAQCAQEPVGVVAQEAVVQEAVVQEPVSPVSPTVTGNAQATPTTTDGTTPTPATPGQDAAKTEAKPMETIRRPTAEKYVPLPIDQEVRKNPDGKVTFNLVGQPWEPVLQWLADASALSLDWQELPADSLNLLTVREYTMEEARDLINRHLLSRGFTMIVNGEVMSIVRTKDLNPALIRRVRPEELKDLPDHTMCKVSFDLEWLIADEAVEELKPMLSSAGQIHKLSRTNRLEVLDTAVSLRQIWELIESEQSDRGEEQLVQAFHLKHRRAEDVIRMLRELLKLQDTGGSSDAGMAMDPNMMMQMMQQMQQAMQQAAAQPGGAAVKQKMETRLVLNQRENMILAHAAPDQMAIIRKAIDQVDVPAPVESTMLQNMNRMQIYRLESVDPQTLVDLLQQLGDLEPDTVLKVDKNKRSIIAWASIADQLTISTLVERLDQSSRKVEVIPLRRLDAEYVAGTIRLLMGKEEEDQSDSSYARRYGFFDFGMMNQNTVKEPSFKVEADIENNRLLVFANPIEMDEIRNLLIKLGELPDPNAADESFRVFEMNPDDDLQEFQRRLQQYWRRGNELQFDFPDPPVEESKPSTDKGSEQPNAKPEAQTRHIQIWNGPARLSPAEQRFNAMVASAEKRAQQQDNEAIWTAFDEQPPGGTADDASSQENGSADQPKIDRDLIERLRQQRLQNQRSPRKTNSPEQSGDAETDPRVTDTKVRISLTPDGKLIVQCNDPEALAEVEMLISQMAQPRRGYKVFRLKYATPSWVALNLKDFFKAEEQTKNSLEYDPWFGVVPSQKKTRGKATLGQKRQPQFISDNFTSTILVRDADPRQLATIQELIDIYDVPEPADTRSMRVTTIFRLKYARASSVAAAVKDVFRDLLSANDKALEANDKDQRPSSNGLVTFLPGSGTKKDGEDEDEPIRFKGLLSIGIEESSNTLIVSSAGTLMETITELVEALDEAANSSSKVQVVKVDRSVDIAAIQERLRELMKQPTPPNLPQQGQTQVPGMPPGGIPGMPGSDAAVQATEAN